jgi:hypothetical protein
MRKRVGVQDREGLFNYMPDVENPEEGPRLRCSS